MNLEKGKNRIELKEKLKILMKEKNLTQENLVKELNKFAEKNNRDFYISQGTLSNWVNGKRTIRDLKDAQCVADYFNVSVLYIIDDNITEPQYEDIDINKILKISSKAIKNIKNISDIDNYITMFNNFLENINVKVFSQQMYRLSYYTNLFKELNKLCNIVALENTIYILLNNEEYDEIKKIFNVFDKIFKDLDFFVLPTELKNDICIFENNNAFKDSSLINIENNYKELTSLFISKNYNDFRNNYCKIVKCINDYKLELFDKIKSIKCSIVDDILCAISRYITNVNGNEINAVQQLPELDKYYNMNKEVDK